MTPLFILLGFLGGIVWFINAKYGNKIWISRLSNPITIYGLLIGWTLFGFSTNLDYTQNWGCVISTEAIFSLENILYSGISVGLLSIGFFIPSRTFGTAVLTCELLFWLYKLYLLKGGYVVGFGGVPSTNILLFDTIALTLRLVMIKKVSQLPFKTLFVLVIVYIIMSLKVQFFR
jgi:hypothetical protein